MTAKSDELVDELVSAAIAFGRGQLPDWQTRIEKARRELRAYIEGPEQSEITSCKFCGSNKLDRRMNSIVCADCGRKVGDIAPEVQE